MSDIRKQNGCASDNEHSTEEKEAVADLSQSSVTTKYNAAADIVNFVLEAVVEACKEGADISTLCKMGDTMVEEKVAGIYNKAVDGEKLKKGVAFPTCISVNEICGHFSPFKEESQTLKKGDMCKIDLGCHIDGFMAVAAHTVVIPGEDGTFTDEGATSEEKCTITGRKADVLMAAWTAAEVAVRTVRVGRTNEDVTNNMNRAIEQFECSPVRGVMSHQMKQHVIDGNQVIISKEAVEEKVDVFQFEPYEVYGIDVFATTGEGKPKESELRTTVYKRDPEQNYKLKTQSGRKLVNEIVKRFPFTPFSLNAFADQRTTRAGISECMRHALVTPFPVLAEKKGEFVAQFKFTVLLLPGGSKRVTGLPLDQKPQIVSSHKVTDESLLKLLAQAVSEKSRKNKAKVNSVQASQKA